MKKYAIIALFTAACGPAVGDGECDSIVCNPSCMCVPGQGSGDPFSVGNVGRGGKVVFYGCDCKESRVEFFEGAPIPSLPGECFAVVPGAAMAPKYCSIEIGDTSVPCASQYTNFGGLMACGDI